MSDGEILFPKLNLNSHQVNLLNIWIPSPTPDLLSQNL